MSTGATSDEFDHKNAFDRKIPDYLSLSKSFYLSQTNIRKFYLKPEVQKGITTI